MAMATYDHQRSPVESGPVALDARDFAIFERVPTPVFVLEMVDRHEPNVFRCAFVNRAYRTMIGDVAEAFSIDECLPASAVLLASVYLDAAIASRTSVCFEDRLTTPGRVIELCVDAVVGRDGVVQQFVGSARDVTNAAAVGDELEFARTHDALTGLPNRTTLQQRLSNAIHHIDDFDSSVALIMIDVDEFSVVNDSLGHSAGDEILVTLARRIERVLRFGDVVARLGGDEFAIVCNDIDGIEDARRAARRIIETIAEPIDVEHGQLNLKGSAGVAIASGSDDGSERLLRDADVALTIAKANGRHRVEVFDLSMRTQAVERLDLEQDLHRAVRDDEFEVFYQPLIRLADAEVGGFEALIRWHHPIRGLINPVDFIPLAEATGLIVEIGNWVIVQACEQVARWKHQSGGARSLVVSVNLSARQLADPDLVGTVAGAVAQAGISPNSLELEITESVLMNDPVLATTILHALRALGVRLAIDDFGTGHSSLGYLKQFPVDTLKVDRSFVQGLGLDRDDEAIVKAVISMGHALGLSVTAEGIETVAQRDALEALGCDTGQGFYFAKPQTAGVASALVGRHLRWERHLKAA